jgi:2-keto-4-pentenoate hydratase/2-oxohepta-3-ene-1,7-dioic acid hydratase in catechol pathway
MRLARGLSSGGIRWGVVDPDGTLFQALPAAVATNAPLQEVARAAAGPLEDAVPLERVRLLVPAPRPGKIVAIGRNYADHAVEAGEAIPPEPLVFAKFPSSVVGPGDPIAWDESLTREVDYEAELAVVIGHRARNVPPRAALDHVFAYTCLNDISARDLQFGDGQWVRGKSLDTFCPIGPWLVTPEDIPDPQRLRIACTVSGELLQDASTADMFYGVAELVSRLSRSFTLEPGDVIATGTPPGVGYYREPKRLLRDGDEVVVRIERIGELRNPVRTARTPAVIG